MDNAINPGAIGHYELHYRSLFTSGRALAFPCNIAGEVPIDDLSARALDNYLYARAVVGLEYAVPLVRLVWSSIPIESHAIPTIAGS